MRLKMAILVVSLFGFVSIANATTMLNFNFNDGTLGGCNGQYGLSASNVVNDDTTPDPPKSLKFTYPAGFIGGNAPGYCNANFSPYLEEVWIMYLFKTSSNWVNNSVFNKHTYINTKEQPGIDSGFGHSEFIGHSWYSNSQVGMAIQLYDKYKDIDYGVDLSSNKSSLNIQNNRWYRVTWHIKLNTPGYKYQEPGCNYKCWRSDGIVQVWVKDMVTGEEKQTLDYNDRLITPDTMQKYSHVEISPVWGGGPEVLNTTQYLWIDDYILSTTDPRNISSYVLPIASGGVPSAPSNLSIQ